MKRFLLLCFATLLAGATWAFDAENEGVTLSYNVISSTDYTYACEVSGANVDYGEINIPSTAYNESDWNTYTVIGIGNSAFERSGITKVTFPETLTYFGDAAFYDSGLVTVTIPKTITSWPGSSRNGVFSYCEALEEVILEDGLTFLPQGAFSLCTSLESIEIPGSIADIGQGVFSSASGLKEVVFREGVTTVGENMFQYCSSLSSVTLPNTLKTIGSQAFDSSGLPSISLPSSLEKVDNSAFINAESLALVELPSSITSIGDRAFQNCSALTSIDLPENLTSIGQYAFASSGLASITLPESLESIGQYAFLSTPLTEISIPESVNSMGTYTFQNCTSLTNVEYLASLSTIPDYMCDGCSALETVDIAKNVETIGQYAFHNCTSLSSFSSHNPGPPICNGGVFEGVTTSECTLYVPKDSGEYYSATEPWSGFNIEETDEEGDSGEDDGKFVYDGIYYQVVGEEDALTCEVTYQNTTFNTYSGSVSVPAKAIYKNVEYDVIGIGAYAFMNSEGLTDVSFAESITYIDMYAFYNCGALTEFTIPSTITTIGEQAIGSCDNLTSITIEDFETTLTTTSDVFTDTPIQSVYVGRNLSGTPFRGKGTITSVTFGKYVTSLINHSFSSCTALKEVTLPGNITEIGDYSFDYCTGLETVVLGEGVNSLGTSAFQGCSSLKNLTFPKNSLETIKAMCFEACTALEEITFPSCVTSLSGSIFDECTNLKKVTFEDGATEISGGMFCMCSALTDVILPSSITTIDSDAFEDCTSLTNISPLDGVETIGQRAFHNCTSLKNITFGDALVSIASYAFMSSGLIEVYIPSVVSMNYNAFEYCYSLQRIVIMKRTEACGYGAFYECTALEEIVLGDVYDVGYNEFFYCRNLSRVYSLSETPPTAGDNAFFGKPSDAVLYVPVGSYEAYSTADKWKDFLPNIVEMVPFSVTTYDATDVTETSAVLNGSVVEAFNESGSVTSKGFVYWSSDPNVVEVIIISDEDVEMSYTLNSLTPETTYTYRAYAITDSGTTYGEDVTFTTLEDTTTGINGIHISLDDENVEGIYSTSGQKLNTTVKGVNIIRFSDGSVKKLYVK